MFGKNLEYLRKKKNLSQADMLDAIGFPRTTWNNYENDKSTPSFQDLIRIAKYFGVSETDLIHTNIEKGNLTATGKAAKNRSKGNLISDPNGNLNAAYGGIVREPSSPYGSAKMPSIVTINEHGIDNILYVPVKAQAGYLVGYEDQQYIETLPSFRMPGLANATYRMFEVSGISMAPTLMDRDRVISEWVSNVSEIRDNRVHVIVHANGVAIKRVVNRVRERGLLYLKSDTVTHRADYPVMEIDPADVKEIWYARMKVSADFSEPSELYTKVSDLEINMAQVLKKLNLKP